MAAASCDWRACRSWPPNVNLIRRIQPIYLDYKENNGKSDQWNSAGVDNFALWLMGAWFILRGWAAVAAEWATQHGNEQSWRVWLHYLLCCLVLVRGLVKKVFLNKKAFKRVSSLYVCECVCWHDLPCIQTAGTCQRSRAQPSDPPPPALSRQTGRQLVEKHGNITHTEKTHIHMQVNWDLYFFCAIVSIKICLFSVLTIAYL